jgi:hypothetical protein
VSITKNGKRFLLPGCSPRWTLIGTISYLSQLRIKSLRIKGLHQQLPNASPATKEQA